MIAAVIALGSALVYVTGVVLTIAWMKRRDVYDSWSMDFGSEHDDVVAVALGWFVALPAWGIGYLAARLFRAAEALADRLGAWAERKAGQ